MAALIEVPSAHLPLTVAQADLPAGPADFAWPQADVEQDTAGALEYVRQRLTEQGMAIPQDPTNLAHLGAFKLLDVHGNKQMLRLMVGRQQLHGGTNAILVPRYVSAACPAFQVRVFFEFQLPAGRSTPLCHSDVACASTVRD